LIAYITERINVFLKGFKENKFSVLFGKIIESVRERITWIEKNKNYQNGQKYL